MRFEQPVSNIVVRFPELAVHHHAPATPRAIELEIAHGVARGRRLHGQFCRRTATTAIIRPVSIILRYAGRLASRSARAFEQARAYRKTVRELHALDDRQLRDIGIDRDAISQVASTLVYRDRQAAPAAGASVAAAVTERTFERARAA